MHDFKIEQKISLDPVVEGVFLWDILLRKRVEALWLGQQGNFVSQDVKCFEEIFPFLHEKNKSFVERGSIRAKLFLGTDGGRVHNKEIVLGSADFGETRPTENSGPGSNPTGQTEG